VLISAGEPPIAPTKTAKVQQRRGTGLSRTSFGEPDCQRRGRSF
jgi:hypothetical protein